MTKLESIDDVIDSVGSSSTWHIHHSSEGCQIDIAGIPVLLENVESKGIKTYFKSDQYVPFKDAIKQAALNYFKECYPDHLEEIEYLEN